MAEATVSVVSVGLAKVLFGVVVVLSIVDFFVMLADFVSYSGFSGQVVIYALEMDSVTLFTQFMLVLYPVAVILLIVGLVLGE